MEYFNFSNPQAVLNKCDFAVSCVLKSKGAKKKNQVLLLKTLMKDLSDDSL